MDKMDKQELISALADGQLRGDALDRGIAAAGGDATGRGSWHAYHVIGEVLRAGSAPVGSAPEAFVARLQLRLQQEGPMAAAAAAAPALPAAVRLDRPAANDGRWKLVAGLASVAAVAAVGWNVWGTAGVANGPQLAAAPGVVIPVAAQAMIRDPRLDRLLAAHRQFGGAPALQAPGFLRSATFEGPAR